MSIVTGYGPLNMAALPTAPRALLRRLAADGGWTARLHEARGHLEFGGLSEATDGNGHRTRTSSLEPVDSICVRARHDSDGRAIVALWMRRTDRGGWSLDVAFRGRHEGEYAPRRLTATQLKAYIDAPDPVSALKAVAAKTPKTPQKAGEAQ